MQLAAVLSGSRRWAYRLGGWLGARLSSRGAPRVAALVLGLALAASLTDRILVFTAQRTPGEPVQVARSTDGAPRTLAEDVAPIAQLLGAQAGSGSENIKLIGVIARGSAGRGVALLSIDGRAPAAVRAGESLSAGVVLAEVRADHVLLSRSGAMQELRIPARSRASGIEKYKK